MHKHELHMRLQQKITYENLRHHQSKGRSKIHKIVLKSFEVFLESHTPSSKKLGILCKFPQDKERSLKLIDEFSHRMKRLHCQTKTQEKYLQI